jgi:hypothetical protein
VATPVLAPEAVAEHFQVVVPEGGQADAGHTAEDSHGDAHGEDQDHHGD